MNEPEGFILVNDDKSARTSRANHQRLSASPHNQHSTIDRFNYPSRGMSQNAQNQQHPQLSSIMESQQRGMTDYQSRDYEMGANNNYISSRNSHVNANNISHNELPRSNISNNSFCESVNYGVDAREKSISIHTSKSKEHAMEKLKFENKKLMKKIHDMKKIESSMLFSGNKVNIAEFESLKTENAGLYTELNNLRSELQAFEATTVRVRKLEAENIRLNKETIQNRMEREQFIREIEMSRINNDKASSMKSFEFQNLENENNKLRDLLFAEQKRTESSLKSLQALQSERDKQINEIERLRQDCSRMSAKDISISKLQAALSNLEFENRKLNETVLEVRKLNSIARNEQELLIEKNFKKEISDLQRDLQEEYKSRDAYEVEIENLKSNLLKLEVEREFNQKRAIASTEVVVKDSSRDRIAELFKMKLDEKTKDNSELTLLVESLKNENHDLKCRLSEKEVLASMQMSTQNRRDKENLELIAINNEELKLQNNFLQKENEKIKEILTKADTNRSTKIEIYKTINEVEPQKALPVDPKIESLILKGIISDFELFRLKARADKFESELNSITKRPARFSNYENEVKRLHYKENIHDESKYSTDGTSFTMSGDHLASEFKR